MRRSSASGKRLERFGYEASTKVPATPGVMVTHARLAARHHLGPARSVLADARLRLSSDHPEPEPVMKTLTRIALLTITLPAAMLVGFGLGRGVPACDRFLAAWDADLKAVVGVRS